MESARNGAESPLGGRIRKLRQARGMTQKAFADSLGIVQGFLSSIERGRKVPSDTLVIALCRTYGVNVTWLLQGKGAMNAPPDGAGEGAGEGTPLLESVPQGFPEDIPGDVVQGRIVFPGMPQGCYAVLAYGDFMAPTIRDGDMVLFDPARPAAPGEIVLVTNRWGEAILRRYRLKAGELLFSPDNAAYSPFHPDPDTRIIGTVVQVWRNVKL
ncbi:LexA family transcriptional regulator [Geobacter sulfurreducens]|jgi:repressor LexA|uniref:Helix-turn-helix transcriptional regulator, LexA-related protein n=1 Tax=Geobacter sulfurreducens (strain ATCC 51573 / DSM 12127 / PCA) TaxID=243231 RepID=Q747E3_GEOSL|nr:XRE family transcriptional regulator [Geobacter sulfurreducens]AAR36714.1 helix-turn-helix transcriptional regulator, LexA-related protein [Geobacter sulfurreducens PCA]ADI86081.1 helix-turn-helix transcriptional regulator, LexA-related [Geobacter sulfurreducens KN400]AJY69554.1 Cro/Cl family transcriptional regulator [Geobacter sulfurreducens]QVW35109.1 LexA family transcriptional regulator [Geobacter sulfurreducens]UAC03976.1 XRE family transcriptional regulator [Geobacter sulfurreducens]